MNDNTTYYDGLIAAYFSGEASPEEVELLSVWLTADQANLKLFEEYRKTWLLAGKDALAGSIDIDAEWQALSTRMEPQKASAPTLQVISGKGRLQNFFLTWKAAAALAVLLVAAAALWYMNAGPDMVVITADAGNSELTLPDGSVITLYKGAVIEYAEGFSESTRNVTLEGEAYFEVKHDEKRPFVVSGRNARIEVLGTSFNVNTNAGNGRIGVVLTTGKVSLYFRGKKAEQVILNPGETAEISTSEKSIITIANPDPNYMAWKTKEISFENTSLRKVMETLGKVYGTEIRLASQALSDCSLTASFDKQPLTSVLNVISATLDLQISEKNGTWFVDGPGCAPLRK